MPDEPDYPAWRPDKIIFQNINSRYYLQLKTFKIIGTEHIPIDLENSYSYVKTPSDHYGLYAQFKILNK